MEPPDEDARRHWCECRFWLRVTRGSNDELRELIARIRKRRGPDAAQRLREGIYELLRSGDGADG